ncbi:hypothetical protein AVMA1855_25755 [Acidovorax sp. SUPP1855]|uniref:S8/S53 family peptidase n=1 Tax=Acidovorax sp. SUPP1855 TaxID=431774 RepID=UPI0023DE5841|nr:S8/S53 family peptidase [Acidovorax sp. SUPP1855]GKS87625.1 hypothetical protein AVMA1855_25755 [Acidovorax sp. SUPP1855]
MRTGLALFSLSALILGAHGVSYAQNARGPIFIEKSVTDLPFASKNSGDGRKNYLIYLDPFYIKDFIDYAVGGVEKSTLEERKSAIKNFGEKFAIEYGIEIDRISSVATPSINSRFTREIADKMLQHPAVTGVQEVFDQKIPLSQSNPGDITSGNETVSWALPYTNTNDGWSTSNNFYLIDAPLTAPVLANDANIVFQNNLSGGEPTETLHSTFIAGLVGGLFNNYGVRGVNWGMAIKGFGVGLGHTPQILERITAAMNEAEATNDFAVASLSMNRRDTPNEFQWNQPVGRLIRAASNRLFFTQSAGNNNGIACENAYGHQQSARDNDGIMVVGGLQRDGSRMLGGTNPPALASNAGACVEAWAPAHEITSLDPSGNLRTSSGTSYAAPIVAAIAARYGNLITRPIEREAYIKNLLANTGHFADGLPIKKVSYLSPSFFSIPRRLPYSTVYAPHNTNIASLYDGRFYDPSYFWDAGSNSTSITLDLGSVRYITGVRVTIRSSAPQNDGNLKPMYFSLWGANAQPADTPLGSFTEPDQSDSAPIYIGIGPINTQYITIESYNPYSSVAFSEIEAYGY